MNRLASTLSRGQGTVELALIAPVLILLAFGALDLGRVFTLQIALVNAAREGARFCALHPTAPNDPAPRVNAELGAHASALSASSVPACTVTFDTTDPTAPVRASVSLQAYFVPITPLVGALAGSPLSIGASATMPV
jgi:Flp pilus assembly protein TadG